MSTVSNRQDKGYVLVVVERTCIGTEGKVLLSKEFDLLSAGLRALNDARDDYKGAVIRLLKK